MDRKAAYNPGTYLDAGHGAYSEKVVGKLTHNFAKVQACAQEMAAACHFKRYIPLSVWIFTDFSFSTICGHRKPEWIKSSVNRALTAMSSPRVRAGAESVLTPRVAEAPSAIIFLKSKGDFKAFVKSVGVMDDQTRAALLKIYYEFYVFGYGQCVLSDQRVDRVSVNGRRQFRECHSPDYLNHWSFDLRFEKQQLEYALGSGFSVEPYVLLQSHDALVEALLGNSGCMHFIMVNLYEPSNRSENIIDIATSGIVVVVHDGENIGIFCPTIGLFSCSISDSKVLAKTTHFFQRLCRHKPISDYYVARVTTSDGSVGSASKIWVKK